MSINQKRPTQTDDFIRIQDLLYLCLAKWKWFVLSLAVTVGIAVFYLLRTPAVYTRTASVLIKDDSKGKSVSSDLESFSEFGLFQSSTNVNNELVALQSPAVMTEVVKRLHLDMNYTVPGRFHRRAGRLWSDPAGQRLDKRSVRKRIRRLHLTHTAGQYRPAVRFHPQRQ